MAMSDLNSKVSAAIMEARSSFFAEAARRDGYTYCDWLAKAAIDTVRQEEAKAASVELPSVPADVARLVVAARHVAYDVATTDELRELDQASEAFASRVPWDDEPADALQAKGAE